MGLSWSTNLTLHPLPWTPRRSNQSILKEINSEYSLEELMLKLKLQYFGHLMQRAVPLEKTLMLGKIEGRRRRGWENDMVGWHHQLYGHEFEQALGDSEGQGSLVCYCLRGHKASDTTEWLSNKFNSLIRKHDASSFIPFSQGLFDHSSLSWFHTHFLFLFLWVRLSIFSYV